MARLLNRETVPSQEYATWGRGENNKPKNQK